MGQRVEPVRWALELVRRLEVRASVLVWGRQVPWGRSHVCGAEADSRSVVGRVEVQPPVVVWALVAVVLPVVVRPSPGVV